AIFNQAQLLGKQKKVDEAIALYQKALDLVPTSQEAKNNIELLTQQQAGGGKGQDQENKDDQKQEGKESKDSKDQKDPKDPKDDKDKKDEKKPDEKDGKEKEEKPKEPKSSPKYKPRPFNGKELSEGDVKKILGELKQQEEKIRAEYNKSGKEQPRDKDW
ncbi:MAG TPA: tetratricopeptide repeat protein, partial [Bdellovibrio sp.]